MSYEQAYTEPVRNYFVNTLLSTLSSDITLPDDSTYTIDEETEIAIPGLTFDAESVDSDRVWYEMTLTTPSSSQSFLGRGAWHHYTGYFNIFIYCPLSFGEPQDLYFAQPLLDAFKMGTSSSTDAAYIRCTSADIIGSEQNDTYSRWEITVRVVFNAEIKS